MSALPISPLVLPAALKGAVNGKLPEKDLVPCGIDGFRMHATAARAMKALVAAANAAGFQVRATGTYRTYDQQENLFKARYTTDVLPGRPTKTWKGQTWYQQPHTAMAATPGTSNHGLGLAVDFAEELDGDKAVESVSSAFVAWLCKHAQDFGFSAEDQSEPWHWRYVAGDATPKAVEGTEGPKGTKGPEAAATAATLRRGASGAEVLKLQRDLQRAGYSARGLDGQFGKFTEGAVKRFQAAKGLKVDGIVGPATWKALAA